VRLAPGEEPHVAAVRTRDRSAHGEAETRALLVGCLRRLRAVERLEDALELVVREAGAVVDDFGDRFRAISATSLLPLASPGST
jgi:hypothetical protein